MQNILDVMEPPDDDARALSAKARSAGADGRWMDAMDLASQALAIDPGLTEAAATVGQARRHLGSLGTSPVELRQLTVLAVDMVRSTAFAASLGPEGYRELMMDLYGVCVEAVARYEGRVTKYVGDGVLAQFGHPVAHEDDARRATLAAQALLDGVRRLGDRWHGRLGERIVVRIGMDAGTVAVGPVAESPWSPDEIAGDPPNVASRVQATADPMTIRVTDAVQRLIAGWFETTPVGEVELRNFPHPIGLHLVAGTTEAETRLQASVRPLPPLVNRTTELSVLLAAWQDVEATRERRVVGVSGPAGIGKSRLVEHVMASTIAAGCTPMTLSCSSLHRDSPLRPVVRALRRLFSLPGLGELADAAVLEAISARLDQLPAERRPAGDAVPILAWLLGSQTAVDMHPDTLRRRLFEVLIELLEALAATAPVVLYVDDVHAADPSTAEFLGALLARPTAPMLVLVTSRGPLPDAIAADHALQVTGLSRAHSAELADAVAPSLTPDRVEQIVGRCDGVPFYIAELARAAEDSGAEIMPDTVELSAFVTARLDELEPELRRLVHETAVAGHEVRVDVLGRLAGLPTPLLLERLQELSYRGILRRSRGPAGEVVRFRHGVTQEAAYNSLLAARRRTLHAKLATILAELPPGAVRPEDLAAQHGLAGEHRSAAHCWLEAGWAAVSSGAHREASELFGRSVDVLAQLPDSTERAATELNSQLGLGTALSTVEGYTSPRARAAFETAVQLAESLDDTTAIFPALWGVWSYWFVLGRHDPANALAERCLAIAEAHSDDERYRWAAGAIVGYQRLYLGDFAGALDELEIAIQHVGHEPVADFPQDPGVVSMSALSVVLWFLGQPDASAVVASETLEELGRLDPAGRRTALTQAWVGCTLAWRAELAGDPAAAIDFADGAAAVAGANGFATWLGAAMLHKSIAQCSLGRHEEALPMLAAVLEAWETAGRDPSGVQLHPVLMTPYFAGRLAEAQLATGDTEAATQRLDALLAATTVSGERFWDADLRRLRTTVTTPPTREIPR